MEDATIVPINEDITFPEVRVTGVDREPLGVMPTAEALAMAQENEVDLVLVAPDAEPPVCRMVEYSKFKYELDKAKKDANKKQRESRVDIKELKIRPGTDVHDYQVRLKNAKKFLSKGDKVKLTLQFRGREMEFRNESKLVFETFMQDLGELATAESKPQMQGRTMSMIIAPKKA